MVGQDEGVPEGELRLQVDRPVLEERVERLGGVTVPGDDAVQAVVLQVEGPQLPLRLTDIHVPLLIRGVEKPVADLVHEPVQVHPDLVLREEVRVLLDEGDDVVVLLYRRMEAESPVPGDDELVTTDPLPLLIQTDEGRVTQAVLPVTDITRIPEDILHGEPLQIIGVSEFHMLLYCYRPSPTPCSAALMPASKARLAMSCGESTPGFM